MSRVYRYVGSPEIRDRALRNVKRCAIAEADDVARWIHAAFAADGGPSIVTVTFVVDSNGRLWIADRRSEHVACANGGDVLAAGELTFEIGPKRMSVVEASNQSTGYCPEIAPSWQELARALDRLRIPRPPGYTAAFEFRRCDSCGATNLIKDDAFECALCGVELSPEWNFD